MLRDKSMRADAAKWRAHQADAQALAGEVERLRAALRDSLGTLNSLTSDKSYGCLKERHREYAEDSIKKLRAALDASRALATQEAKS
jgi:hypothetical protein